MHAEHAYYVLSLKHQVIAHFYADRLQIAQTLAPSHGAQVVIRACER